MVSSSRPWLGKNLNRLNQLFTCVKTHLETCPWDFLPLVGNKRRKDSKMQMAFPVDQRAD